MARPTTFHHSKLSFWLGDGATPTEDFVSAVCGITAKEFTFSAETSDFNIADCDDPEAPAWTERSVRVLSANGTGSGVMAWETFPVYRDWMLSGLAKNARIVVAGTVPGYFAGSFVLTTFGLPSDEGNGKVSMNIAFASNGEVAWVVGAP